MALAPFIPLVSLLGVRIEKEPNKLDIRCSVASEMDLLTNYKRNQSSATQKQIQGAVNVSFLTKFQVLHDKAHINSDVAFMQITIQHAK